VGNTNAEAVIKCNEICNRYGLDTISTGATLAWAIECYENEALNLEETGGLDLRWGNAEAIVAATQALADGTGLGATLALGSKRQPTSWAKGTSISRRCGASSCRCTTPAHARAGAHLPIRPDARPSRQGRNRL